MTEKRKNGETFEKSSQISIGLILLTAIVVFFVLRVLLGFLNVSACETYLNSVPPVISVDNCRKSEIYVGDTLTLIMPNKEQYVVALENVEIANTTLVQLSIKSPSDEEMIRYLYAENNVDDILATHDIVVLRQDGHWYLRYSPDWKISS